MDWILVLSFMILIAAYVKRSRSKNVGWLKLIILNVFLSIFMIILTQVILDLQIITFEDKALSAFDFGKSLLNALNLIELYFLIYASLLFIIYIYYYIQELKIQEEERRILQEELSEAKISILKSQMQPHFLFNTLNSISSLMDVNKTRAQDTIADLSNFLRDVLNVGNSNIIKLKLELDLLKSYIRIMKVRHGAHLKIYQQIDFECYNYGVPSLMLQPLVENAIKHGFSPQHKTLNIEIKIARVSHQLIFTMFNDGKLIPTTQNIFKMGLGLSNLKQRIEKLYGKDASFQVYNIHNEKTGVKVEIILPALKV
ncbi:sensor histidine kinase [Gramella sp. KN1008]|uniref:sensor histidine kinase n=1 Tax=Gramella sp. KN1008 TaxID=2529298 RepID=UPI00103EC9B7|nr:histidine kinase [Gramella sp. KN1008]TBW25873.1 hypothetical protein EZJ28_14670 [Gramella sp. KN1008]